MSNFCDLFTVNYSRDLVHRYILHSLFVYILSVIVQSYFDSFLLDKYSQCPEIFY